MRTFAGGGSPSASTGSLAVGAHLFPSQTEFRAGANLPLFGQGRPPRGSLHIPPSPALCRFVWNRGVPAGVASASLFAISDSLVKASIAHVPSQEVALFRAIPSLILGLLLARHSLGDAPWFGRSETRLLLVLRGVLGASAIELLYEAVARAPLNEATVAMYTSPVITAFVAWILLGERLHVFTCLGALVSLLGVAIVAVPEWFGGWAEAALIRGWAADAAGDAGRRLLGSSASDQPLWSVHAGLSGIARRLLSEVLSAGAGRLVVEESPLSVPVVPPRYSPHTRLLGIFFAFLSAVTISGAHLTIRAIGKRESAITMSLWFSICSFVGGTVSLAVGWPAPPVLPTASEWGYLLGAGLSAYGAQLCLGRSLQLLPASVGSALTFVTAVELAAIGSVAYGETIVVGTVVGGAATLLGVYLVTSAKTSPEDDKSGEAGAEVSYQPVSANDDDDDPGAERSTADASETPRGSGDDFPGAEPEEVAEDAVFTRLESAESQTQDTSAPRNSWLEPSHAHGPFPEASHNPWHESSPPDGSNPDALPFPSAPSDAFVLDDLELGRTLEEGAKEGTENAGAATELVPLGQGFGRRHPSHDDEPTHGQQ